MYVCVCVRVARMHVHMQTQQDRSSLTFQSPSLPPFSLCVIKMLIETKSAKRYVITCMCECE